MKTTKNPANQKVWHVIYTRSRAGKKVYADLTARGIECFLPLQKQLRQWKDRKKWVEMPLMPGYCFVHITRSDYDRVLNTKNVVAYVVFEGKAAVIPDKQIDSLKQMLRQTDFKVEVSHETFRQGKKVGIINGPLLGLTGELKKEHGNNRFILRIDAINTVFKADVPAESLTCISS
jgi:transcription antitermination factor NusG